MSCAYYHGRAELTKRPLCERTDRWPVVFGVWGTVHMPACCVVAVPEPSMGVTQESILWMQHPTRQALDAVEAAAAQLRFERQRRPHFYGARGKAYGICPRPVQGAHGREWELCFNSSRAR